MDQAAAMEVRVGLSSEVSHWLHMENATKPRKPSEHHSTHVTHTRNTWKNMEKPRFLFFSYLVALCCTTILYIILHNHT